MRQKKFGFDWQSIFGEESLNIMVMYIAMGWGGGKPAPGVHFFQNHKSSVHLPISIKFFPSNEILTILPIQMHGHLS